MKTLLNIIGSLLLLGGIGLGIYIIVAAATQAEGFDTLKEMILFLVYHAVAMLLGIVFIGLGLKQNYPA